MSFQSSIIETRSKYPVIKKMKDSVFTTSIPLPRGMNAYNSKTKRFVRWRKGYDQPALEADVVSIPLTLLLNNKYIYWNDLGYYEMCPKDSSDFRATNKLKLKQIREQRSTAEVNQNVNNKRVKLTQSKDTELEETNSVSSTPPYCPWEIDVSKGRNIGKIEYEHKEYVPKRYMTDTPVIHGPRPCPPNSIHSAGMPPPHRWDSSVVFSFSQSVTRAVSIAQQPSAFHSPVIPSCASSSASSLPVSAQQATDAVPWYVAHTPIVDRVFCQGNLVTVTSGAYSGCSGVVKDVARAGKTVLPGQLKVRVETNDGQGCTAFIAAASLQPREQHIQDRPAKKANTEDSKESEKVAEDGPSVLPVKKLEVKVEEATALLVPTENDPDEQVEGHETVPTHWIIDLSGDD